MLLAEVGPNVVLDHAMDVEARIQEVPVDWHVQGMFFSRLVAVLGTSWRDQVGELVTPPRGNRYLPFKTYSQRDYSRLIGAAATRKYPRTPVPEAIRRLGRADFDFFGDSTLGKVVLAAVRDAHKALHATPKIYGKMAPGFELFTATDLDDSTVRYDFKPQCGFWEYQVGQWEGIVAYFGRSPRIRIEKLEDHHFRYDVVWR